MSKTSVIEDVFPGSVDEIEQSESLEKIKELVLNNKEFEAIVGSEIKPHSFEKKTELGLPKFDELKLYYVAQAKKPSVVETRDKGTSVFKRDCLVLLDGKDTHEIKNEGDVVLIEMKADNGNSALANFKEKAKVFAEDNDTNIKATVLLACLLVIQFVVLLGAARSRTVKDFVISKGLILFSLGVIIFIPLVYLVPQNVRMDTDAGYIFCRHLRNLPMPVALLLALNVLSLFFYFSWARFGSIQPIPIGLGAIAILGQFLMGFTMDIPGRAHEAAMATMFTALFFLLLFSFRFNVLKFIFFLVCVGLAVVCYAVRHYRINNNGDRLFDDQTDMFFAAICFAWVALIPTLFTLGHYGADRITVQESISMNKVLKILLLIAYIAGMIFYAVD